MIKKQVDKATKGIRSVRAELSQQRGHIYLSGTYTDPPKPGRTRGPLSSGEIEQIRQLKAAGLSHEAVALRLGVNTGTITRACSKHQIPSVRKAQGGRGKKSTEKE